MPARFYVVTVIAALAAGLALGSAALNVLVALGHRDEVYPETPVPARWHVAMAAAALALAGWATFSYYRWAVALWLTR